MAGQIRLCQERLLLSDRAHIFKELFEGEELFDVEIFCIDSALQDRMQSYPLKAHRVVLAAASPVLRRMLTGQFAEAGKSQITLDIDFWAMEKTLQFVYAGRTQVDTVEHLVKLGQVADHLDIENLRESALSMASDFLSVDSCAALLQVTSTSGLGTLEKKAREFFCRRFLEVAATPGFLGIDEVRPPLLVPADHHSCS
jgi:hypothetical protein